MSVVEPDWWPCWLVEVEGDDAGNDIYKQLGAMASAGDQGWVYGSVLLTHHHHHHTLTSLYLPGPAADGMGPLWSTNNITWIPRTISHHQTDVIETINLAQPGGRCDRERDD